MIMHQPRAVLRSLFVCVGCWLASCGESGASHAAEQAAVAGSESPAARSGSPAAEGIAGTSSAAQAGGGRVAGPAGAPAGGNAAGAAAVGGMMEQAAAGSAGQAPPSGVSAEYADPGSGPWQVVAASDVAEVCKLDPAKLAETDRTLGVPYAIVRYGKLCHRSGTDSPAEIWSITKGLTGVVTGIVNYETRDIQRSGPMTGQLRDWDRADHWLPASSISFNKEAKVAHVLAMIAHNDDLSYGNRSYQYDAVGTVQINRLSDMMNTAIKQDSARLGANLDEFTHRFLFDPLGMKESTWSNGAADKTCAYTWNTTLNDMLRLGLLVLHRGVWSGKRVLDEAWIYKMTHPSFEDSNRGWGYLTRLTTRAGKTGEGGAMMTTAETDSCTPAAVWPYFPHGASEAEDCLFADASQCKQQHDAGMFGWQGAGGQWLAGHPGLELVLAAKNYNGGRNDAVWKAVRPALVALDPKYKGDEAAFCAAYGSGNYAPDLVAPWVAPPPADKP